MSGLVNRSGAIGSTVVLALGVGGCGGASAQQPTAASPAQIRGFLADAEHGLGGTYSLSYDVTVGYGRVRVRRIVVSVAQRSARLFTYRTSPSLALTGPDGPAASAGYAVYVQPRAGRPGAGIYSCSRRTSASRWRCNGPYGEIGMGGMQQLLGAYPPRALVLGLENAAVAYTGVPSPPAIRRERAFRTTRRVSGYELRCLNFGSTAHPLGTVCLRGDGVIAAYALPQAVTFAPYVTAQLVAYSPRLPAGAFDLPARP